jgi:2-dehydro-3-deoxygluconokinase
MTEVLTLGECFIAFVALQRGPMAEAVTWSRTVAGAEGNVAVGLARLGVDVGFIGRVGDDGLGTAVRRRLRGEGVDVGHLHVDGEAPTGVMFRELRDLGPAEVVYWRRGSAGSRLSADDVREADALFGDCRWLHVTGITPALSVSAAEAVDAAIDRARTAGATISLDVNVRRRLWSEAEAGSVLGALAARCDVILGSVEEVALVGGEVDSLDAGYDADPIAAADALLALGPRCVVVKLGADGALARIRGGEGDLETVLAPALGAVSVVDPVGAGDAFTAGFIAASLEGATPDEALRVANACGASAVATFGDLAGLPTRRELERLLAGSGVGPDTLR